MDYITRSEFERFVKEHEEIKRRIEQRTEEIRAVRVDVASEDVTRRLDNLKQELHTISNTWLDTLQEHYTEHKQDISEVQTVQRGHSKYFEEHGKRLAATATKEDISELKATVNEHGSVLKEHSSMLKEHSSMLKEQGAKLDQILALLKQRPRE